MVPLIEKSNVLLAALGDYGLIEYATGEKNNPDILRYFHEIGQTWVQTGETAWCSAFVNYFCKHTGREYSGMLNARSWLDVGYHVKKPELGDVVVLWREHPESWKGHVGFFIAHRGRQIYMLGGNQNNSVCIQPFPEHRLLDYRRV